MPRRTEFRNQKIYERSTKQKPYEPKPPRADAESVWSRIETLLAEDAAAEGEPAGEAEKTPSQSKRSSPRRRLKRRRLILILDSLGVTVWTSVIIKLFVGDLDRVFVSSFLPQFAWLLDMRWLVALILLALVLLLFRARNLGIAVAYVAFFPLVLAFWKLPKLLIEKRSKALLSTLAGLAAGFAARSRFFVIALAVACLSGSLIVSGGSPVTIAIGMVAMTAALLWWLLVTSIDLFHSSSFIRAQERAIQWAFQFHLVETLITPNQPDQLELKKWTVDDAKKFRDTAGNAVLARRALLFWAAAVDQYRRGPAAILLNGALLLFLLVLVVVAFSFVNFGVYAVDPGQFSFSETPGPITFVYYSAVAISFGEISALAPESAVAVTAKLANGVVGGVGVVSIIGSTLLGYRSARAHTDSHGAASRLREKANDVEQLTALQFQMSLEDLQPKLKEAQWTLFGIVNWLTSKTPVSASPAAPSGGAH